MRGHLESLRVSTFRTTDIAIDSDIDIDADIETDIDIV